MMRRALLIYNPASGRRRVRRLLDVQRAAAVLHAAGIEAEMAATHGPGTAGEQARAAIAAGFDTVFACGGDGTMHEVLQGVIGTGAALGIIPLGTANSLASELCLPRDPASAARLALSAERRQVTAGQVEFAAANGSRGRRYFLVSAGVGADAHLFYSLNAALKKGLGMAAYYTEAVRLWAVHRFPMFEVEFTDSSSGVVRRASVSQALAVRIANFGGLLSCLAPGADLYRPDLRLLLIKSASRLTYLNYLVRVLLRRPREVNGVELAHSSKVICSAATAGRQNIHVEADGELLGAIPAEISVAQRAVTLLVPSSRAGLVSG